MQQFCCKQFFRPYFQTTDLRIHLYTNWANYKEAIRPFKGLLKAFCHPVQGSSRYVGVVFRGLGVKNHP